MSAMVVIDVLMMSMSLSNIAIFNIHGDDYRCIISGISEREMISLMQNIDLTEKNKCYKKQKSCHI